MAEARSIAATGRAGAARRTVALRRWAARALIALPGVVIILSDVARRHGQFARYTGRELLLYASTCATSMLLWGGLVAAASRRRGWERVVPRAVIVVLAAVAVGAQGYFFHRYQAYLNHRAVLVGTSMLPSVGQQLWSDRASFLYAIVPPIAIAAILPVACARLAPSRPWRARRALDLALLALFVAVFESAPTWGGEQGASPDVLYLSSMGKLAHAKWEKDEEALRLRPGARTPLPVPPLVAKPAAPQDGPRNVLVVLTESVRASDACSLYDPACATTPFTNAELPARFGFAEMRAVDSTTAISLAVLWNGLAPTATRADLHAAPLVWEYAHAAGFDTGYWTAQNLLFANAGTWLEGVPLTRSVSATELDPEASYEIGADDGDLVDRVLSDLRELREPFFGVVHLSNTHFPYKIDPDDAPFQPQRRAFGEGDAREVHNRYKDAVYLQDRRVARLVRELRARREGARTVVVFLSDHGEQIRERGAIGHTFYVTDEEIHVPMWIDAPPGALAPSEEKALRRLTKVHLTMLDVLPTLLDLMGVWDAPSIAGMRAKMPGESLLRGGSSPDRAVVLTNCTELFACAFKNWGAMRGTMKLFATENDHEWGCYDTARDPHERTDLGEDACGDLRALAEGDGRGSPF